jgi:hypothetical protein
MNTESENQAVINQLRLAIDEPESESELFQFKKFANPGGLYIFLEHMRKKINILIIWL